MIIKPHNNNYPANSTEKWNGWMKNLGHNQANVGALGLFGRACAYLFQVFKLIPHKMYNFSPDMKMKSTIHYL